jgi:hypothetical protein
MKDNQMWQKWFAWYPVAFGPYIVWMKTVQRKQVIMEGRKYWFYRRNVFPL